MEEYDIIANSGVKHTINSVFYIGGDVEEYDSVAGRLVIAGVEVTVAPT